jgi:subtilisin family serine protease
MPDADPLDQCEGHGTHVAGIVGADPGNEYNISGVAYGASLYSYRVFGCEGDVSDDGTRLERAEWGISLTCRQCSSTRSSAHTTTG